MHIPIATYRLQFQPEFGFGSAADILAYLSDLGISDIYASPIFRAREASTHGYDGLDPNALNPGLGSPEDWQDLTQRLQKHHMGWLQDIVPNHMAFDGGNPMLADVLENGPSSRFHNFFDICWNHPSKELQGKVMAPFLGGKYSDALVKGEIRLVYGAKGFAVAYGGLTLPLRLESYLQILNNLDESIASALGEGSPDYQRWLDTLDGLENIGIIRNPVVRRSQGRVIKQTLWDLYVGNAVVRRLISETMRLYDGDPGRIESFRLMDRLLTQQWFRLCDWQNANQEINYRRFFDINELIALRQEYREVFEHTHGLVARLSAENIVSGVRVDHIDGLADPTGYLQWLRRRLGDNTCILVEKILTPYESLPSGWPVQGTTGYDFGHWINQLFVDADNENLFNRIYSDFSGITESFEEIVYSAKKGVLTSRMAGDVNNLAVIIRDISSQRRFADHQTSIRLKDALVEILAWFPVYRTYCDGAECRDADREAVQFAVYMSIRHQPRLQSALGFIRDLLIQNEGFDTQDQSFEIHDRCRDAVRRFQQLSAALTAKGFEDTAFYRYHRLVSLNEVGGDPVRFGRRPERFHEFMSRRAENWPHAMNSTASHDAKRGEDVRARLNVLSEIPLEWENRLEAWHRFTRHLRIDTGDGPVPDKNTEYLLYQVLIGAWPQTGPVAHSFADRIKAYMIKAAREAGERTSWRNPREEYEAALTAFVDRILDPSPRNAFMPAFVPFCNKVAFFGMYNSLSQCLIKITAPGFPDFYQGTELMQLALVDPDNRRPVDYEKRRRALQAIGDHPSDPRPAIKNLLNNRNNGYLKLLVIHRALQARSGRAELFRTGYYLPLVTTGSFDRHIVAFARRNGDQWCVVAVPRFVTALVSGSRDPLGRRVWRDTVLKLPSEAPRTWQNVFTREAIDSDGGAEIAVGEVLRCFPVALLLGK